MMGSLIGKEVTVTINDKGGTMLANIVEFIVVKDKVRVILLDKNGNFDHWNLSKIKY